MKKKQLKPVLRLSISKFYQSTWSINKVQMHLEMTRIFMEIKSFLVFYSVTSTSEKKNKKRSQRQPPVWRSLKGTNKSYLRVNERNYFFPVWYTAVKITPNFPLRADRLLMWGDLCVMQGIWTPCCSSAAYLWYITDKSRHLVSSAATGPRISATGWNPLRSSARDLWTEGSRSSGLTGSRPPLPRLHTWQDKLSATSCVCAPQPRRNDDQRSCGCRQRSRCDEPTVSVSSSTVDTPVPCPEHKETINSQMLPQSQQLPS